MANKPLKVADEATTSSGSVKLPLNLGLNDGTYASEKCAEVLRKYNSSTSFRNFPSKTNHEMREAIAADAGVAMENVFVANGSGSLLKTCVPYVIEKKIRGSVRRIVRHYTRKNGYPIHTPQWTYFKVPHSASRIGLHINPLPLSYENGFKFSVDNLAAELAKTDGFVYLANPNNPTGNVLVTREQLIPLLQRFPNSMFMVDEAYVDYIPEDEHQRFTDLVPKFSNLLVLRTFSFAHGLAAARIGAIFAPRELVTEFELKTTPHSVGSIASDLVIASLSDPGHLKFVQEESKRQREFLIEGIRKFKGIEVYDSQVNFFLSRFTDGRSGHDLAAELQRRQIKIKVFEPVMGHNYDEFFRITIGLAEENQYLLEQLDDILG